MFETTIEVRYGETDQMGVVYHANYIPWLEIARTKYMEHLGYQYKNIEEMGVLIPVIEVNCKYLKPAKYGDHVTVKAIIKSFRGVKLYFEYEVVHHKTKEILVKAETVHTFVDKEFKPIRINKVFSDFHDSIIGELNK